jgi:hypothetical protein
MNPRRLARRNGIRRLTFSTARGYYLTTIRLAESGDSGTSMNKKQTRTLEAIFADPVRADIDWRDVESLFNALGAELTEARGSRIKVALNGRRSVFHKPHPEKEVGKKALRTIRDFLIEAGLPYEN